MRKSGSAILRYKIPNRKRKLITYEFLLLLKKEHDITFYIDEDKNPTYLEWYSWFVDTKSFEKIFENVTKEFNVYTSIYKYAASMNEFERFKFFEEIMMMMVDYSIIDYGEINNEIPKKKISRIRAYSGYTVIEYSFS